MSACAWQKLAVFLAHQLPSGRRVLTRHLHASAYVSIRLHASAYAHQLPSGRRVLTRHLHTSAYVSIRLHASVSCAPTAERPPRFDTSPACVSIRQHTSACVSIRAPTAERPPRFDTSPACVSIRQHTSAYVSIRQHTSAYASIHFTSM
jgi:hypothetical protein